MDEEYEMLCAMATFSLSGLATYTDGGAEELSPAEAQHLMPVIVAFQSMVNANDDDGDDDNDFRVDGTLY